MRGSSLGAGRHDNPDHYSCLYVGENPSGVVAEALAPFRGTGPLTPDMLRRAEHPLALATIDMAGDQELVDLDDPAQLVAEDLPPSAVATRRRPVTQAQALVLHDRHPQAPGLRWWSTLESSWPNVTLFDRARPALTLSATERLEPTSAPVAEVTDLLGL
ncbi:MAG: RES domain-containing protein [Solirubrobacterales bacterium]